MRCSLARFSCLIFGVLFGLLFLVALLTCRMSGFPFAIDTGQAPIQTLVQQDVE
jgi:hypothetical protein